MPTPCSLDVGGIEGGSEKEHRWGTSDLFEIEHHLHRPVDPTTGLATGVRVHSPLRITKLIDSATPAFHAALCTGQILPEVTLNFYRIDPDKLQEAMYYKISLRNALIVDIRPYMPMTLVSQNESLRNMEQVSFAYEEIEWEYEYDKVAMDRLSAPDGA